MCTLGGCSGGGYFPNNWDKPSQDTRGIITSTISFYNAAMATPDPKARKDECQAEARARRWNWLTQEDIDRSEDSKPKQSWLESCPGGLSTLLVLVCFVAGMCGAYLLWKVVK